MFVCCAVSSLTSTVGQNLSESAASPRSFPASFTPKFNLQELQKKKTLVRSIKFVIIVPKKRYLLVVCRRFTVLL
jgi:hypothetical protein